MRVRPPLSNYRRIAAGKVRDLYEVDESHLLIVTSDRISAYDHILSSEIPDKGRILTAMSLFWFALLEVPNHLAGDELDPRIPQEVLGRAMVVRKLEMVPVECIARGYLTGSGLADYQATGSVCGIALPAGLEEASRLPEPIFTPTTKAELGEHDESMEWSAVVAAVGEQRAQSLRELTLRVYSAGAEHARGRGVILADTKFEFGVDPDGGLVLADEVLTPDSSRYWDLGDYTPGRVQPSFDKQFVRNWLTGPESGWDRAGDLAPPPLPDDVIVATRQRYIDAYERISGKDFAAWPKP